MNIKKFSIICVIIMLTVIIIPKESYGAQTTSGIKSFAYLFYSMMNSNKTSTNNSGSTKTTTNTNKTTNTTNTKTTTNTKNTTNTSANASTNTNKNTSTNTTKQEETVPTVMYKVHIQGDGWQKEVANGNEAGTTGKSKRMEAIQVKISNNSKLGITYRTHIQTDGWTNWVKDGAISGTTGKSKRLEAIEIKLTGDDANKYDVYYCIHSSHFGWLNWAKNGETSGTTGIGVPAEAIKIQIVKKGDTAPAKLKDDRKYVALPSVEYRTRIKDSSWASWVKNGTTSGTTGQSKILDGIEIKKADSEIKGSIKYKTHVQGTGWTSEVKDGETSGQSKRIEAIQIRLIDELEKYCDIYYRAHIQSQGWLDWAKNGESAGSANLGYRLEAIQIKIVLKGQKVSGSGTGIAFITSGTYNTSITGDGYPGVFVSSKGITYKCFQQNMGSYAGNPYWTNTIATDGCGPTSIAIIASGLRPSVNANPGKTCEIIRTKYGNISTDDALLNLMKDWGMSGQVIWNPTAQQIQNELKNGKVMMLLGLKANGSIFPNGSGHFFAALDINSQGKIFISNPNGKPGASTGWYDAATVAKGCSRIFVTDAQVKK